MNIYFISGLGADRRAFDKIKLDQDFNVHYIDWLEPSKNEDLKSYAERMASSIDKISPFALVGLSFGGIIAIEISKLYPAQKVILISSISNQSELPWYYKSIGKLGIQNTKLIELLKYKKDLLHWFFGTTSARLKNYLNEMIDKTSIHYLQWSLNQILNWNQINKPKNVLHIHGEKDKLFPTTFCKPDYTISKGGHFMIVTHANQISEIINHSLHSI